MLQWSRLTSQAETREDLHAMQQVVRLQWSRLTSQAETFLPAPSRIGGHAASMEPPDQSGGDNRCGLMDEQRHAVLQWSRLTSQAETAGEALGLWIQISLQWSRLTSQAETGS